MFEPSADQRVEKIKVLDKSVIIVDNFYENPDEIRDLAIQLDYSGEPDVVGGFPGMRGHLDTPQVKKKLYQGFYHLCRELGDLNVEAFEKNWDNLGYLVNITKDSELRPNPMGIIPHQDFYEDEPGEESTYQYGAVVYLNTEDECAGGTNLYSYEGEMSIPSDYKPNWMKGPIVRTLSDDLLFKYIRDRVDSNDPYQLEFEAEMKYNRMFLYSSKFLHSANLDLGMFIDQYRINQVFFM